MNTPDDFNIGTPEHDAADDFNVGTPTPVKAETPENTSKAGWDQDFDAFMAGPSSSNAEAAVEQAVVTAPKMSVKGKEKAVEEVVVQEEEMDITAEAAMSSEQLVILHEESKRLRATKKQFDAERNAAALAEEADRLEKARLQVKAEKAVREEAVTEEEERLAVLVPGEKPEVVANRYLEIVRRQTLAAQVAEQDKLAEQEVQQLQGKDRADFDALRAQNKYCPTAEVLSYWKSTKERVVKPQTQEETDLQMAKELDAQLNGPRLS